MERIIDGRKSEHDEEDWFKIARTSEEMDKLSIKMPDFEVSTKMLQVQPPSRREGFSSIPNVKWEDIGGLDLLKRDLKRDIVSPIKYPSEFKQYGVDSETGFLLHGPSGCGKTLIVRAVANEAGANFIHIKIPELLNKYVGESESPLPTIFNRARTYSPCIIFLDEIDALIKTTSYKNEPGYDVTKRLLTQLVVELDGAYESKGVYVIGATNCRLEVIDQVFFRPGRFGKVMHVPRPNSDERGLILKALSRNKPIDANVDLFAIAKKAAFDSSGADLSALMNEAAMAAFEETISKIEASHAGTLESSSVDMPHTIKAVHFDQALSRLSASRFRQR